MHYLSYWSLNKNLLKIKDFNKKNLMTEEKISFSLIHVINIEKLLIDMLYFFGKEFQWNKYQIILLSQ